MTSPRPPAFALSCVLSVLAVTAAVDAAAPQEPEGAPARLLEAADLDGLSWRSVGPANMGGRVSAIALVPGSRRSFYVGYATGGVFRTDTMGTTFTPVFDDQPLLTIGAIAVADAPGDWVGWPDEEEPGPGEAGKSLAERGRGRIVWVGTGEGNGRNSSSWGNGVYRSTDGGRTFTRLGLEETHDIPALAVDPRDPDTCYVAALGHLWGPNPERGLYKTTDGGRTWRHVLAVDEDTGACDVVLDPQRPDTVYAALYARRRTPWSFQGTSESGGLFRSDDGGATWRKLTNGLPPRTGRIGLTVWAKDPGTVFAVVESDWGGSGRTPWEDRSPSGGLFRSRDRGESWQRLSDLAPRPFYFAKVAVDPEDDRRVYLPGYDLGISDDGGRTFRRSGSEGVHVDFHAIVINPVDSHQILVGTDGGLYISHDRAETWDYLDNVAAGQFYRIAVDMGDPYRIGGGLQDNGSWVGPSETPYVMEDGPPDSTAGGLLNRDWDFVGGGDGFTVLFDPTDPGLVYTTSQGGMLVRTRLDTKLSTLLVPAPKEGEPRLRFNWDAPFLVSAHDPTVLYLGGNRVFKLTERGDRWFAVSPDLTLARPDTTDAVGSDAETFATIVSLAESPASEGVLWTGSDDGLIHVTTDEGRTWTEVTPPEVAGLYVADIVASQHDEATAYAVVDGHRSDIFEPLVLLTTDLGESWRAITGDLPAGAPVRCLTEDPDNPQVLYAGAEFAAHVTLDRGRHWVRLNAGELPPTAVHDLVVHPRERDLVAATHGRSVWILDGASLFAQMTPELLSRPVALFSPLPARPRQRAQRSYGVGRGLFMGDNPPPGAPIDFWVRDAAGRDFTLSVSDAAGVELKTIRGITRRGVNRVWWDLQADAKHRFDGPDQGWPAAQKLFVPAGAYTVAVTVGDERDRTTLEVLPAPTWDGR